MKPSTKLLGVVFLLLPWTVKAQTNVNGGIYSNTTWTLASSPYIVVDTVVVFPGVTLTIEPGVTVKFMDGKYIEIRQGTLIATGTATDSITFTSNSATPTIGIYRGIVFTNTIANTIDYCVFKYADQAVNAVSIDHSYFFKNNYCCSPLHIKNTTFYNNNNCIGEFGNGVSTCFLDSCIFTNNQFGVGIEGNGNSTNCIFNDNGVGLEHSSDFGNLTVKNSLFCNNTIGLQGYYHFTNDTLINCNFSLNHIAVQGHYNYVAGNILSDNDTALAISLIQDSVFNNYIFYNNVGIIYSGGATSTFFNNYICHNTPYNIIYTQILNGSIPPVCYCDTDSATIRSKIYDGYVNIARGLLSFTPFVHCDSSVITALPPVNCPATGIIYVEENNTSTKPLMEIYPNPSSGAINIYFKENTIGGRVKIYNILGKLEYSSSIEKQTKEIDVSTMGSGVYIIEATAGTKIIRRKFIIEKSIR